MCKNLKKIVKNVHEFGKKLQKYKKRKNIKKP